MMAYRNTDYETVDQFSQKISEILMSGYISIGIAIGAETGLFDVMAKFDKPMSSEEIAETAGMKKRYVQEWLGGMVTSNIIDIDLTSEKFFLPRHRISTLQIDTPGGLAGIAVLQASLLQPFYDIIECFKQDGPDGIPNDRYQRFFQISTKVNRDWMQNKLLPDCLLKITDLSKRLEEGMNVVDIGCGHAELIMKMARIYPKCRFVGVDICEASIMAAKQDPQMGGLDNITLLACDAAELPSDWTEKFQLIMFHDSLHDMAFPEKVMGEINRAMSSDGILSIIDTNGFTKIKDNVGIPGVVFPYICSMMYSLPASLAVGKSSAGLGSMWGKEKAIVLLRKTGFNLHSTREVQGGEQIHYVCTKRKELKAPPGDETRPPGDEYEDGDELDY